MIAKNIYRSVYILTGITGLLIQFGIFDGSFDLNSLVYYTVLSNIICVVYFILRMIHDNSSRGDFNAFGNFIMSSHTKFSVTMSIMLTFLIYHFLLQPEPGSGQSQFSPHMISNIILHYVIPIMTIIDFLVFDREKTKLKWYDPFIWIIIPAVYFIFILLRAPIFGNIGRTASPYPYPFIDFTIQSVSSVIINIIIIVVMFIALGYLLMFLDWVSKNIYRSTKC